MKLFLIGRYSSSKILTGPEKVALNLFLTLHNRGLDPTFITYYFKDFNHSTLFSRLWGKETISEEPLIIRLGIVRILWYILSKRVDIIHVVTFERFLIPIISIKFLIKIKLVYTLHGIVRDEINNAYNKPNKFSKFKDRFLESMLLRNSDYIVFLSEQSKKFAEKYCDLSNSKFCIIPNGVSPNFFVQNVSISPQNKLKIVFYNGIGNNIDRGLDVLVNVLDKSSLKIDLFIIGKIKKIDTKNISIHLIEPMDESALILFLKDKNIFVNSVTPSTFSLMALEAMAAGLIIVISDRTGLSEYIENGVNGFIYKSENLFELIQILNDIHSGLVDYEFIRRNVQKTCCELNWNSIAGRYVELYNKLLS